MFYFQVYKGPLENQEEYNEFSDLIQTFKLFRGKNDDDEEPEVVGEFKVRSFTEFIFDKSL